MIFNNKSSLGFRLRQYWSRADNDEYFELDDSGALINSSYVGVPNINFNSFAIDLVYNWNFSPGSELSIVWKNSIRKEGDVIVNDFFENMNDVLNLPATNSFSIKLIYYLDYQYLTKQVGI